MLDFGFRRHCFVVCVDNLEQPPACRLVLPTIPSLHSSRLRCFPVLRGVLSAFLCYHKPEVSLQCCMWAEIAWRGVCAGFAPGRGNGCLHACVGDGCHPS